MYKSKTCKKINEKKKAKRKNTEIPPNSIHKKTKDNTNRK